MKMNILSSPTFVAGVCGKLDKGWIDLRWLETLQGQELAAKMCYRCKL